MQPSQIGKIISANISNEVASTKFQSANEIGAKPFNSFLAEASAPQNSFAQADIQRYQTLYDQAKAEFKSATKALIAEMQHLDKPDAKAALEKLQKSWDAAKSNQRDAFNNLQSALEKSQNTAVAQNNKTQSFESASDSEQRVAQTIPNQAPANIGSRLDSCNTDNFSAHLVTGCFSGSTQALLPLLLKPQSSFLGSSSAELMPMEGESAMGLTPYTASESTAGLNGSADMVFKAMSSNLNMLNPVGNDSINHTAGLASKLKSQIDNSAGVIFDGDKNAPALNYAIPSSINAAMNPAWAQELVMQPGDQHNASALHAAVNATMAANAANVNTANAAAAANMAAPVFPASLQHIVPFMPSASLSGSPASVNIPPSPVSSNSVVFAPQPITPTNTGSSSVSFVPNAPPGPPRPH